MNKKLEDIKLLIVDDNALNAKLIFFQLKSKVQSIDFAYNGRLAVDMCADNFYDIILMDLMMPILDGYQATREIRTLQAEKGERSVIIGLTSNVYDSDKQRCLDVGMDIFMTKPFDRDEFIKNCEFEV